MAETICKSCEFVTLCPTGRDSLNGSKVKIHGCSRYEKKPIKTNADRIRAMTDEELAELLCGYQCNTCDFNGFCDETDKCEEEIIEWLKQESGGE